MENFIIVAVIFVILAIAIFYIVRHSRQKSGCCGGGDYKGRRKRLSDVRYKKTFKVEGMHCDRCRVRVEEIVNDIAGVSGRVKLSSATLTVSYSNTAPSFADELIKSKLERVGYHLSEA